MNKQNGRPRNEHDQMGHDDLVQSLTRSDFFQELHHLLWLPPAERRGRWDMGWNCRDHAFIAAVVAALFGTKSVLIQGKAMFVQGPIDKQPPVGIEQAPHAWLRLPPNNYIDLSVRLGECRSEQLDWPGWPTQVISAPDCVPLGSARFIHTAQPQKYKTETAIATNTEGARTAVYLREQYPLQFSKQLLFGAFSFCNSPMTNLLRDRFGQRPDLYARAALHLFDLIDGETESLGELDQLGSWDVLTKCYEKPFLTVCFKAGL